MAMLNNQMVYAEDISTAESWVDVFSWTGTDGIWWDLVRLEGGFSAPGVDGLVVVSLDESVQRWNLEHPELAIRRGHVVLEINDKTTLEEMHQELRLGSVEVSRWYRWNDHVRQIYDTCPQFISTRFGRFAATSRETENFYRILPMPWTTQPKTLGDHLPYPYHEPSVMLIQARVQQKASLIKKLLAWPSPIIWPLDFFSYFSIVFHV